MASAEVVVCGAGIAGISAAHELGVRRGVRGVVLVDERPPLTLTSDKSSECYRDWWPQPPMARLMARSIERLEELAAATGNAFAMNRDGYLYLTATEEGARAMAAGAERTAVLGAGPLRVHRDGAGDPPWPETPWERLDPGLRGADLLLDPETIHRRFPFLAPDVRAALHARRCGWLSAQQLGMVLLEQALDAGVTLRRARLVEVRSDTAGVAGVRLAGRDGGELATRRVVLAPGPELPALLRHAGVELPLLNELHAKVTFDDELGVIPRHVPMVIWSDTLTLDWSEEERAELAADSELAPLLGTLPAAVHFRPEGGTGSRKLLLLWAFDLEPREPVQPPTFPEWWPDVVVRGIARMVPGFAPYVRRMRRPFVDGGYYTKARDNMPVIGPHGPPGLFLLGALSGYGIMAAQGAAELLGAHVVDAPLPEHAAALLPARLRDAGYLEALAAQAAAAGQL
jgi:glycine/D-amino acid oxidase-like deaminating enzyme